MKYNSIGGNAGHDWTSKQSQKSKAAATSIIGININQYMSILQGVFFAGPPPKKLKYGKPRLGEVRLG